MDQEPRTGRPPVGAEDTEADERPEAERIKADIQQTRKELGDTVEALAEKTDVKAQAKQRVDERKEQLKSKAGDVRETISGATPQQAQEGVGQVAERARERPLPFAVAGAFAAGVLIGRLTKRS